VVMRSYKLRGTGHVDCLRETTYGQESGEVARACQKARHSSEINLTKSREEGCQGPLQRLKGGKMWVYKINGNWKGEKALKKIKFTGPVRPLGQDGRNHKSSC